MLNTSNIILISPSKLKHVSLVGEFSEVTLMGKIPPRSFWNIASESLGVFSFDTLEI